MTTNHLLSFIMH